MYKWHTFHTKSFATEEKSVIHPRAGLKGLWFLVSDDFKLHAWLLTPVNFEPITNSLHEKYKPSRIFSTNRRTDTNRHHPSPLWRVVTTRSDRDDPPTFSPHSTTPQLIFFKSLADRWVDANWHHPSPQWRVVTIHPDWDDPPTFSPHSTTPQWIFADRRTDANWHHPSPLWRVVTIRPDRDDPPTLYPTP